MRRARPLSRRGQAGVTLIELMISMLLASILSAGLFYMMSSQQRTYSEQLSNMTAQQNITGAMEYLQGQIWRAGYGFTSCGGQIRAYRSGANITIDAFTMQNSFNLFTGATDPNGSDSFSVAYSEMQGIQLGVKVVQKMPSSISASALITNAIGGILSGHILVIWKPGSDLWCSALQATGNATSAPGNGYIIPHTPSAWNSTTNIFPVSGYPVGAIVMNLGNYRFPRNFAIDHSRNPPQLITWSHPSLDDVEVIADGIEDMQVSYACDMNGNGVLDEGVDVGARTSDEWANNVPSDVIPSCIDTAGEPIVISLVRLTLISRSPGPILTNQLGFRPGAEDHHMGDPTDDQKHSGGLGTYSRAVLTNTIKPRNIRGRKP